jgi:hypothetical protein
MYLDKIAVIQTLDDRLQTSDRKGGNGQRFHKKVYKEIRKDGHQRGLICLMKTVLSG